MANKHNAGSLKRKAINVAARQIANEIQMPLERFSEDSLLGEVLRMHVHRAIKRRHDVSVELVHDELCYE